MIPLKEKTIYGRIAIKVLCLISLICKDMIYLENENLSHYFIFSLMFTLGNMLFENHDLKLPRYENYPSSHAISNLDIQKKKKRIISGRIRERI